ncbi:FAD-dependent oxidoreductase [Ectobacillus funiculus]|uniref:FAD-dependent oxidoreductase n=1 Tax=Ectobacillus funiculus TaxID=137993 RepID=UPI0039786CC8
MKHDLVIVGGGVIGKAIALNLVKNKIKVLLIDPNVNNGIASLAAGGMLGAFGEITHDKTSYMDQQELEFRIHSARMHPNWINQLENLSNNKIHHGKGTFIIGNASSKDDYRNIDFIEQKLLDYQEEYQIVNSKDIPGYKPNNKFEAYKSIFIPNEGYISSIDLLNSLNFALEQSSFYENLEDLVIDVALDGYEKIIQTKSGMTIKANDIILCSGIGIRKILEASNIDINVPVLLPGKGVSLVVETDDEFEFVTRTPNRDFAYGTHIVPRGQGKLYIGATNRISDTPGINDGATTGEINSLLHSVLHEINTDLRSNNVLEIKYGSRPVTIDRFPLIGQTNINGVYVATGTFRNGILMAPLVADIMTDILLKREPKYTNPFSLNDRKVMLNEEVLSNLIDSGVKDLVSFIQEPTGSLPFNRQNELNIFINTLLKMILLDNSPQNALISELKLLIQRYPMSEVIPQIYYMLQQTTENKDQVSANGPKTSVGNK